MRDLLITYNPLSSPVLVVCNAQADSIHMHVRAIKIFVFVCTHRTHTRADITRCYSGYMVIETSMLSNHVFDGTEVGCRYKACRRLIVLFRVEHTSDTRAFFKNAFCGKNTSKGWQSE